MPPIQARSILFNLIAIGLAAIGCAAAQAPAGSGAAPASIYRDDEPLVTEPDGQRVWHIRWAVGGRDRITTLRIPAAYVELAGAGCHPFGPTATDPGCQQPCAVSILLQAMLPDFTPRPARKLTPEEEDQVVHILLKTVMTGRPGRTEAEALR